MSKYGLSSLRGWLSTRKPTLQWALLNCLDTKTAKRFRDDGQYWLHIPQLPPREEPWRSWLFLGGRGAGKTRAGAEWVKDRARLGLSRRIALIAPTFHDVREVLIDGASGIRSLPGERPRYEPSRRRLLWNNGAEAYCFSAEDPESLRGPQFDAAWGDEIAYWSYPAEVLATLSHGLRVGQQPRLLLTSTPRPMPSLRDLVKRSDVAMTTSSTFQNAANLAPGFISALQEKWTGSAFDRQELYGELIDDPEGALWRRADLEAARLTAAPSCSEVVVAVDPPAGMGPNADACGIIVAGAYGDGAARRAVVLGDASVQGLSPHGWAERAVTVARLARAHTIVAEANNGGELVRTMLTMAAPELPVRLVHARADKRARAMPVAALYEMGRVAHAATFGALEDEMCSFGAPGFTASPDRLDALVWALTHLMLERAEPRLRAI